MKKLTKKNLDELAKSKPVLTEEELDCLVGGADYSKTQIVLSYAMVEGIGATATYVLDSNVNVSGDTVFVGGLVGGGNSELTYSGTAKLYVNGVLVLTSNLSTSPDGEIIPPGKISLGGAYFNISQYSNAEDIKVVLDSDAMYYSASGGMPVNSVNDKATFDIK